MKKIGIIFSLMAISSLGFSQLKVITNGDVKIGTTGINPTEKLEVDGNFSITKGSEILSYLNDGTTKASLFRMDAGNNMILNQSASPNFGGNASGVTAVISNTKDFTVSNDGGFILKAKGASGNVGIGLFNPSHKLSVNGPIFHAGALVPSDKRLKNNVNDYKDGLSTVLKINPIIYNYNGKAGLDPNVKHIGVYAQELQKVAPQLVGEWDYQEADQNDNITLTETYLSIDDTSIKYLLINAIKEQQEIISSLQDQINELAESIASNDASNTNEQEVELTSTNENFLGQNRPNPFDVKTVIDYKVNSNAKSASLVFHDIKGNIIKEVNLDPTSTELTVNANEMPSGVYSYQLKVEGKIINSQKMVITK